ncbi:MAG: hypothetical protein CMB31_01575 [Euryarchaeota archaeon]|nr:hypothetical protein [Euryarchaeota archaeon]
MFISLFFFVAIGFYLLEFTTNQYSAVYEETMGAFSIFFKYFCFDGGQCTFFSLSVLIQLLSKLKL